MKLRPLFASAVAASALLAGACAPMGGSPATVSRVAIDTSGVDPSLPRGPEGPAIWRVADEDTTIYLFGTVHVLPSDVEWYDAEIAAALTSADSFVTEIRMDPASEAAMNQLALERAVYTDGTTLRSLLDEEQTAKYEAALASLNLAPQTFDRFEPWMAGLTLTLLPLLQQGYEVSSGVEKVLISKIGDTPQGALETAEFQLGLFDNLPQDQQIAFMIAAAEAVDEAQATLDSMVTEWVEGDAEGLARLMNEDMEDEALAKALLYDRNANWADWIEARMEQPGTVFIAVGAGHLAGEHSVQEYLAERGLVALRAQ